MTLATRISATHDKLSSQPEAGRATPSVTATLVNGRARLSSGPFNWDADLGQAVGGENLAPSPTAYLLGALAGCGVVFLRDTLGPQLGVEFDAISATARCTADTGGLLGIPGTDPALASIELEIAYRSSAPRARLAEVEEAWRQRCPIFLALQRPNEVAVRFEAQA